MPEAVAGNVGEIGFHASLCDSCRLTGAQALRFLYVCILLNIESSSKKMNSSLVIYSLYGNLRRGYH